MQTRMGIKRLIWTVWTAGLLLVLAFLHILSLPAQAQSTDIDRMSAFLSSSNPLGSLSVTAPDVPKPEWYAKVTVYYTVSQNGTVVSDLNEFATLAGQTLNDSRGWSQMGVRFVQVASGGSFKLILSQASLLPSYSSACSSDWSCNVGNNVIINDDRWAGASSAWNNGGGSLRDYRHMVVNHETGHWLGHGHRSCGGAGQLAPVMQQQSIDLMGCKFNPWPLESELFSSRLGL